MLRKIIACLAVILLQNAKLCAEQEIKLGFILPLSGDAAPYGKEAQNAAELALAEINENKLLPGSKLSLVYEDDQCSAKAGLSAAKKLVEVDKLPLLISASCSSGVLAAASVAERNKSLFLAIFASNPEITNAGDYVFRLCPSDAEGGRAAAELIAGDKRQKVAIISENSDYAMGVRRVFKDSLEKFQTTLASDETYNSDQNDFRALLLRVKATKPDALFLNPQSGVKAGLLIRQVREMGWEVPSYGTFAFSSEEARKIAGDSRFLEGLKFTDAPAVTGARAEAFLERFKQKHGPIQSEFLIAFTYDAIYLFAEAIKQVGLDATQMKNYLYRLPAFHGLVADYHFDKNGDVVGVCFSKKTYREGKIAVLD